MGYKNYYRKDLGRLGGISKEGKLYEGFDGKEGGNFGGSGGLDEGNGWN